MRKIGVSCSFVLLCILFVYENVHAWPWGAEKLVTINGTTYTTDDFKNWWINWKEKDSHFPASPAPFIDWYLLVQEAEKMELFNEPEYRHKINVFLKARTLLLYKGEKINSLIEITDREIKDCYEESYLPRLQLQLLYFNDEDSARRSFALIKDEKIDLAQFTGFPQEIGKNAFFYEEKWIRAKQLSPEWQPVVAGLTAESMADPLRWSKGFVIIYLKNSYGFDAEDFEQLKPTIINEIRGKKEQELTVALIEQLKIRYQVKINKQILDALHLESLDENLLDETLFTIDNTDYKVKSFLALVNKELQFRKQYGFDVEEGDKLKKKLLEGVFAQTLTTKAALDEHYENKEPLKPLYTFYTQHRLIRELEKRLFSPNVHVDAQEIDAYYHQNSERFSQPETVTMAVVEDEANVIDRIYEDMMSGSDLLEAASRYYSGQVPVESLPYENLDPVVRNVVNSLAIGEASKPFVVNGHNTIIKLLKRTPATPMPIDHLYAKIAEMVEKEEFEQVRSKFLSELKEKSVIEVDQQAWGKLEKELGDQHAGQ